MTSISLSGRHGHPVVSLVGALLLVGAAVGIDSTSRDPTVSLVREWWGTLVAVGLGILLMWMANGWSPRHFGFRARPVRGWRFWLIGPALFLGILIIVAAAILVGETFRIPTSIAHAVQVVDFRLLVSMVIVAPALEEILYRSLLCGAAEPVLGRRGAVI